MFVLKAASKFKLIFYFILVSLFLKEHPKILMKQKRLRMEFLGFIFKNGISFLYSFLLVHISSLYFLFESNSNFFGSEAYITFSRVPYAYELEGLFEATADFIEYFFNYKLIFFFKFNTQNKYIAENEIRCLYKFPVTFNR
jgi:hypothetical protein